MRKKILVSVTAAAMIAAAVPSFAQQPAPGAGAPGQGRQGGGRGGGGRGGGAPAIKEVTPGVYMVTGAGGNSTVRVAGDGVIVVDTKNRGDENYDALMAQIRTVTQAPVRYVFVTHHHQDHSGNIGNFQAAGAEVIVHEGLNTALDTYAPAQGTPEKSKVTYATSRTVTVGNATAEARHFESAHTGGDTFVYFPDVRVVALGDSFVAAVPNVDYPFGGSAVQWVRTLDGVLKWDFDVAIPGHGNDPLTKADVQAFRDRMNTVVERGRALVKKGTPKDQLIAQIQTDDLGWNIDNNQWNNPERLDLFYADLSK